MLNEKDYKSLFCYGFMVFRAIRTGLLASTLLTGLGCVANKQTYHDSMSRFSGSFDQERVSLEISPFGYVTLEVVKPSGNKVIFMDDNKDSVLDRLRFENSDNRVTIYNSKDEIGAQVVREAQATFDNYLARITEETVGRDRSLIRL